MAIDPSGVESSSQFYGGGALSSWPSSGPLHFKSDLDIGLCISTASVSLSGTSWIHLRDFKRAYFSSLGPSGVDSYSPERHLHAILAIHTVVRFLSRSLYLRTYTIVPLKLDFAAEKGGMAVSAVWRHWSAFSHPPHQTAAHRRDALCPSTKIQKQAAFGISRQSSHLSSFEKIFYLLACSTIPCAIAARMALRRLKTKS